MVMTYYSLIATLKLSFSTTYPFVPIHVYSVIPGEPITRGIFYSSQGNIDLAFNKLFDCVRQSHKISPSINVQNGIARAIDQIFETLIHEVTHACEHRSRFAFPQKVVELSAIPKVSNVLGYADYKPEEYSSEFYAYAMERILVHSQTDGSVSLVPGLEPALQTRIFEALVEFALHLYPFH